MLFLVVTVLCVCMCMEYVNICTWLAHRDLRRMHTDFLLCRLAASKLPKLSSPTLHSPGCVQPCPASYVGAAIQTQGLMLILQMLLPTEPSLQPQSTCTWTQVQERRHNILPTGQPSRRSTHVWKCACVPTFSSSFSRKLKSVAGPGRMHSSSFQMKRYLSPTPWHMLADSDSNILD